MAEAKEPEGAPEGEPVFDTGAAAIAVALDEARADPSLRDEVAAFLAAQRSLIEDQKHHLKSQFGELRLRKAGEMVKLALQSVTLAAALALVVLLGLMVRDARHADGLVITRFSAPPSFADRGFSGDALASDLTSRISAVARFTNANSLSRSQDAHADSAETVKLEIPETGVSLDELGRFLNRHLGHETRITGDVRDLGDGSISIAVSLAGADPIVVRGPAADMDGLMQKAAEQVFAAFDPSNYIIYLGATGRTDEAYVAAQRLAQHGPTPTLQAVGYSLWANADGNRRQALERAEISTRLLPRMMFGWMEASSAAQALGHDETMLAYARRLQLSRLDEQQVAARPGFDWALAIGRRRIDKATGDFTRLEVDNAATNPGVAEGYALAAEARGARHDGAGATQMLALAVSAGDARPADMLGARWAIAYGAGDWPAALSVASDLVAEETARRATAKPADSGFIDAGQATRNRPWLALALAMTGHPAEAQALIAEMPLDCYLCARVRARVAEAAQDHAAADHWFAEAVRQGPSVPLAHLEWGQTRLARGDAAGAITEFAKARPLGPRFADPLEAWGEALAATHDDRTAIAKYAAAAEFAPHWGRLHLKWGEALGRLGHADQARAHLHAAAGLYLSGPDRAELAAQHI